MKKENYLFHAFNKNSVQLFWVIPYGVSPPHSNTLQYYVKREKHMVNYIIFPSGCEAHAFLQLNNGNNCFHLQLKSKNIKIGLSNGLNHEISKIFLDNLTEGMK